MAERYEVDVIANVQQYIKPLSELPGITKANAEKAALVLATSLGTVEGAAAEATVKVQAFNKSLIEQGVSEKAAAAATLKYASSLATAGNQAAQATTATGNLGKQADVATERVGNTAQAAVGLGRQLSDVASQLSTGTNPLTILIQQGPQAADAVMMAGFSLSKIASAIPPLALAVAALAAGYSVLANATYDAEQAQLDLAVSFDGTLAAAQKMQAAALDVERAHKATTDSVTSAALALAVQTGQLKEYEVAAGAASRAVVDGAAEERQARQELNAVIGARVEVLRRAISADETDSSQKPKLIQQHRELSAAYRENVRELRTLEEETALLAGAVGTATVDAGRAKEAEEAATKARQAHEKAIRAQEEALRALSQAMQAENDEAERTQKTYQGAIDAINGIERAQKQAIASEGERIDMAYAATLDTIAAEERKAMAVSNSVAATETIQQEAERAREAARAVHIDAMLALDDKRTADAQKAAEEQLRAEQQLGNARLQLASTLAGAIGTIAATAGEHITDEQKQAAQVIFAIQKAAALAQIALNTILAVSQASTSAPPPYNAIPMGIAAVTGAAQFAAAAASPPPKFHAGTLSAAPNAGSARRGNEFTAVLEGGEAVIPRATMQQPGAKEQAAALVSGRSPVSSDEVAKGMDRSSLPYYLEQLVSLAKKAPARTRNPRPGQKVRYGVA